jgi:hypothetical protein
MNERYYRLKKPNKNNNKKGWITEKVNLARIFMHINYLLVIKRRYSPRIIFVRSF